MSNKNNIVDSNNREPVTTNTIDSSQNIIILNNLINEERHVMKMITEYEHLIYPTLRIQTRKKYISAAFWNYISTPINFVITLFTGLTAGQAGSNTSYLSSNTVFIMLFVCFILSTVNIFFKLKEKAELNFLSAKTYESLGNEFMDIKLISENDNIHLNNKLHLYIELKKKIDDFVSREKIESVNYFTEFIYWFVQKIKSKKIISLLHSNADSETNEIFKERTKILAELTRTGVISSQESRLILADLNERLKRNMNNRQIDWREMMNIPIKPKQIENNNNNQSSGLDRVPVSRLANPDETAITISALARDNDNYSDCYSEDENIYLTWTDT